VAMGMEGASAEDPVQTAAAKEAPPAPSAATRAIAEVLAHPDFKHEETRKLPRWKFKVPESERSEWMKSVEAFFKALAKILRAGVWVIAAIAILILVLTLHYWWRVRAQASRSAAVAVPTHVGGLDIRTESLPDDIATAARARWAAGDREGALSLLYRGALSQLVHRHGCRIGAAFTEDECVAAARRVLSAPAHQYLAEQARVWVLAIYGRRWPRDAAAMALIDGYATHFPRAAESNPSREAGAVGVPA
ncbi:MAG: hypothetical protein JNJ55_06365, partial [Betaproteobacteria bacterium]|nr:hypothetical protein [Betaproteobacteria bacterium]